jgi:peptide/nickel transport system ATP-binding protein
MTSAVTAPALTVRGLDVHLGHPAHQILHGVDLEVAPGEVVGLIGETGSGKSTLARTVLGLVPVGAGETHVQGTRIDQLRGRALREHRRSGAVQYVFQDPLRSLDPDLPVSRSVLEGAPRDLDRAGRHDLLTEVLDQVGLEVGFADRLPYELSGGLRQRVAIARALAVDPAVLLCDEPVSALDAAGRLDVLELLRTLTTGRRTGTLLITHDIGSLIGIADRVAVLFEGRLVEVGATADLLLDPRHPYTALLKASVPPLRGDPLPAEQRRRLREQAYAAIGLDPYENPTT